MNSKYLHIVTKCNEKETYFSLGGGDSKVGLWKMRSQRNKKLEKCVVNRWN